MPAEQTRRTVLETTAALGSLAVVGSLSGCTSLFGEDVTYTNWLYTPGAVDSDHYHFSFGDLEEIRSDKDHLDESTYESLSANRSRRGSWYEMGIDRSDVDTAIFPESESVFLGEFDRAEVVDELEDNEFDEEGDHEDYTILSGESLWERGTSGRTVIGVRDGVAIYGHASTAADRNPREGVEAVIDAERGDVDRYTEENEDMALLTDELGSGTYLTGWTG